MISPPPLTKPPVEIDYQTTAHQIIKNIPQFLKEGNRRKEKEST